MLFEKPKKSFFGKLSEKFSEVFLGRTVDEELLEELEEVLITSDIGMETTMKIIGQLREDVR
ncbi:signal recognition particle receptor subunit alpha, partial [Aminipila sp.]